MTADGGGMQRDGAHDLRVGTGGPRAAVAAAEAPSGLEAAGQGGREPRARALGPWLPVVAAVALCALLLWVLRGILLPFLLAGALAYLIAPAVDALRRWGVPRPWAILLTYTALAALAAGFGAWVLPDLIRELQRLSSALPALSRRLQAHVAALRAGYSHLPLPAGLRRAVDAALRRSQRQAEVAIAQATADLLTGFRLLFALAIAPVLTYYFLADLPRIQAAFSRLLPARARQPVRACLADLDAVLAGFVRGELLVAVVVGVLATLAALLLGLRYAFTIGLAAFVGELVPYLGPVLGALPALTVAATQGGLPLTLVTLGAYLAIQQLESVFLSPRIMGGAVGLHPLVTISALLVGEYLGGLVGVLLAVPAVACLRVLTQHVVRALTVSLRPRRLV